MRKRQRGGAVLAVAIAFLTGLSWEVAQSASARAATAPEPVPIRSVTPAGISLDGGPAEPQAFALAGRQAVTRTDISPAYDACGEGGCLPPPRHGQLKFRLIWRPTKDDVDLHVVDPQGHHIWYRQMESPSGGRLDRDDRTSGGAETVSWPAGGAPAGTYRFYAVYYRGQGPRKVGLEVVLDGRQVWSEVCTLEREDDRSPVFTFTLRPRELSDELARYHGAGWDNVRRHGPVILDAAEGVGFVLGETTGLAGAGAGNIVQPGLGTMAGYAIGHQAPEAVTGVALTGSAYVGGVEQELLRDLRTGARQVRRSIRDLAGRADGAESEE